MNEYGTYSTRDYHQATLEKETLKKKILRNRKNHGARAKGRGALSSIFSLVIGKPITVLILVYSDSQPAGRKNTPGYGGRTTT